MADDIATPVGGGKKGKLSAWIKKNKTLSIVIGAGGAYFLWHELHSAPSEELAEEASETERGAPLLPNEISHEGVDEEITRVGEEVGREREEREEGENRGTEETVETEQPETVANEPGPDEGPGFEPDVTESPSQSSGGEQSVSIHGKTFHGAKGFRISRTGETGGKKYIEYVIEFPGKNEHWQYFTATGNWRLANNSAATPSSSPAKVKAASNISSGSSTAPKASGVVKNSVKVSAKGGVTAKSSATGKTIGIAAGQAVGGGGGAAHNASGGMPQNNAQHPQAVNTGNRCINGGVGGHTAPAGYHLFCQGGWIWRAPNS